jgi:hypothetical protein
MRCEVCEQRVYLVQNVQGERFWVGTFTGQRWCRGPRKLFL